MALSLGTDLSSISSMVPAAKRYKQADDADGAEDVEKFRHKLLGERKQMFNLCREFLRPKKVTDDETRLMGKAMLLEELLYQESPSLDAYKDRSTLEERYQKIRAGEVNLKACSAPAWVKKVFFGEKWTAFYGTKPLSEMRESTYESLTLSELPESWRNIAPHQTHDEPTLSKRMKQKQYLQDPYVDKEYVESKLFFLLNEEINELKEQNKMLQDAVNQITSHLLFRPVSSG